MSDATRAARQVYRNTEEYNIYLTGYQHALADFIVELNKCKDCKINSYDYEDHHQELLDELVIVDDLS